MIIKTILICILLFILGGCAGFVIGVCAVYERSADGVCFRLDDGEVYLKMSEAGQRKLADPSTMRLELQVTNPRNKQRL